MKKPLLTMLILSVFTMGSLLTANTVFAEDAGHPNIKKAERLERQAAKERNKAKHERRDARKHDRQARKDLRKARKNIQRAEKI